MSPVAASYINIPGYVIFWILFAIALGLFVQRIYFLIRLLKLGRSENRFDHLAYRLLKMLRTALSQSSNLKSFALRDPAPIAHSLMFWGLGLFVISYIVFIGFGAGFSLFSIYSGSAFETAFFSILDIVALLVILAVIWTFIKRYLLVPERLKRVQTRSEKILQPIILIVMISLMILHFCLAGFGYAASGLRVTWPPIGGALSSFLINQNLSTNSLILVFRSLWWFNYIILLAAIIYAPRSKHLHPVFSFPNLAFQSLEPRGALRVIDLNHPETFGAANIQDFTWKQLMDLYSCTMCGRCHTSCPAQISGKPLSPRELILKMEEHLMEAGPLLLKNQSSPAPAPEKVENSLIGKVVTEDEIWACTTCRACQEVCPVSNEHIDKIIDIRRHLIMVAQSETARDPLKNLRVRGHPWRGTSHARTDWAEDMDIKILGEEKNINVLYWVGCTEALEDRSLEVAKAVAKLMKKAGVNFGILGEEEMCCGDPARRMGAEHLFQMLVKNNIQLLQSYDIQKIVTACPHCFNTLKNEYPQFGGRFEVVHHTQFLAGLVKENKLRFKKNGQATMTYQEPCYLGRYNNIFQEPRDLIKSISGINLVEMKLNRKESFCCGGGGGRMWLEEKSGQRISEMRLDQALATRAQILTTACPFCLLMFEDAAKEKAVSESLRIADLAELAVEFLEDQ